jgi:hypothetical protein
MSDYESVEMKFTAPEQLDGQIGGMLGKSGGNWRVLSVTRAKKKKKKKKKCRRAGFYVDTQAVEVNESFLDSDVRVPSLTSELTWEALIVKAGQSNNSPNRLPDLCCSAALLGVWACQSGPSVPRGQL